MARKNTTDSGYESIPFRMHPRVFAALGADLVTNDVVAVIELVKNSYDAFANNVWIRFKSDKTYGDFIEIEDDGQGMTKSVIEDVWCIVATPFKEQNPIIRSGNKIRRVAGEKGLGRLSVARLGKHLHMLTQAPRSDCWEVDVNWSEISSGDDISTSFVACRKCRTPLPFKHSGTILRIYELNNQWDEDRIVDLEQNLARLISPFSGIGDFNIFLRKQGEPENEAVRIQSPEFLSKPKYAIIGEVDTSGKIECTYYYAPIKEGKARKQELKLTWGQIFDDIKDPTKFPFDPTKTHCGPFSFEIRAWDIGSEDRQEIAERFDLQKSQIRGAIHVHKGISIYRDGVLVLPKSENARDWLNLDLRRISKVGTRLSTNQLVGYVSISADKNPKIEDTSDRERLVSTLEVAEFEEILKAIVEILENQRDDDRDKTNRGKPLEDLFGALTAEGLIEEVVALADEGASASEAVSAVRLFGASLDAARYTIQERFIYYSRLATVGTIAQMLVHEIRNRTIAFGAFLRFVQNRFSPFNDDDSRECDRAQHAVNALEQLADTFSPLASRSFRRRRLNSILEERIRECIVMQGGEIRRKRIRCRIPNTKTQVSVDPGELDAILLNLINNAVYWLNQSAEEEREIEFQVKSNKSGDRVQVTISDTGPGISEEDIEKIFWPGVTRKPGGIGMGLTVASELVGQYGGRMATIYPGKMGGASFTFDLPLKESGR